MIQAFTEYKILSSMSILEVGGFRYVKDAIEKLEDRVNAYIALGWECQGGAFVAANSLYQTMVKHPKENK